MTLARIGTGLTQSAAAEAIGVARGTYNRWERGIEPVPVRRIARIAEVFSSPALADSLPRILAERENGKAHKRMRAGRPRTSRGHTPTWWRLGLETAAAERKLAVVGEALEKHFGLEIDAMPELRVMAAFDQIKASGVLMQLFTVYHDKPNYIIDVFVKRAHPSAKAAVRRATTLATIEMMGRYLDPAGTAMAGLERDLAKLDSEDLA